jgi:hypothetical protein
MGNGDVRFVMADNLVEMHQRRVHQSFVHSSFQIFRWQGASVQSLRRLLDTLRVVLIRRLASTTRLAARRSGPAENVVSRSIEHRPRSASTHP